MTSETKLIVRYAETDQMGIAHHSNYAVWYEAARTDFIRQKIGLSYTEMERMGIIVPLLELSGKFLSPAYYEDELTVRATLQKASGVKLEFSYEIYRNGEEKPIHTGRTLHGLVGKDMRPFNMKKKFPELYQRLLECAEPEQSI